MASDEELRAGAFGRAIVARFAVIGVLAVGVLASMSRLRENDEPEPVGEAAVSSTTASSAASSASLTVVPTTTTPADSAGPVLASPVFSDTKLAQTCEGPTSSVKVSVQVSDESGVAGVTLSGTIGGKTRTWSMKEGGAWAARIAYGLKDHTGPSGPIKISATAMDALGNKSTRQLGQLHLRSCSAQEPPAS
ncbi:hypothetical protein NLX83_37320 [Allokutzneria sp. A3M-2-11 16]|uniref:hypothetical protein n=1 Tax=Allokutzneria sp. A3M-2-11 16 TaxID=2962043 RepID=UPI0020B7D941|nr:hypothetical protein [Allokutzneria sp. A3M-2-11 16]MCP3804942.1 hypothetical protein [Allokutzneria sp. A3M-2-11 16]